MIIEITSSTNPKLKELISLKAANKRKKLNLITLEGDREIDLALKAGWVLESLFYCPELFSDFNKYLDKAKNNYSLTKNLFEKISYSENPQGILATAEPKYTQLNDIKLSTTPLIIILETVEKPGNLGAILRTAYASGVDAVIINNSQTDIYNPNVLRASMGRIFTVPTIVAGRDQTISWLKNNNIKSLAAATTGKKYHHQDDLTTGLAIVMGTEATGLSEDWLKAADELIKIPMRGDIDSLNVSVSAAIIIYEALRQRNIVF